MHQAGAHNRNDGGLSNNRTMAIVYVDRDSISLRDPLQENGCSPQQFIILKKELQRLEEEVFDRQRYSIPMQNCGCVMP